MKNSKLKMGRRTHHWPKRHCYYCGKPAVAGCDGVNYYLCDLDKQGIHRIRTKDLEAVGWCDRMLCEEHATIVGMTTASGRVDTIDFCPKHMTLLELDQRPELRVKEL